MKRIARVSRLVPIFPINAFSRREIIINAELAASFTCVFKASCEGLSKHPFKPPINKTYQSLLFVSKKFIICRRLVAGRHIYRVLSSSAKVNNFACRNHILQKNLRRRYSMRSNFLRYIYLNRRVITI